MARLYIIRPAFEDRLEREAPLLSVGPAPVALVAHGSFSQVSLSPGKHVLSLKPGATELSAWNKTINLTAEASKTYYLAVWMNKDSGRTIMFVPLAGAVLPLPTISTRATGVLHEFITEAQALDALTDLPFMTPAQPRY